MRLWAVLPLLVVLAFRAVGPEDLDDNDQAKQALYALDVYQNANWILPQERGTQPATKPPLYPWLATGAAALSGGPSAFACRLPSALASLLLVLLVFQLGLERWNRRVGWYAAWIFACSHIPIILSIHVRPDAVLALAVNGALFALHRAELGRPRGTACAFWICLTLGLLAKGPVALVLVLGGVVALSLSAQNRQRLAPVLGSPWAWCLVLPAFWLLLAYLVGGSPYIQETVLPETLDRVMGTGERSRNAVPFGYLIVHFIADFLPWSLATAVGVALLATRGGRDRRSMLGLLASQFAVGLLVLNLSKGQRADYLLPLLPAASLVAAVVLTDAAPWMRSVWRAVLGAGALAALSFGGLAALETTPVWVPKSAAVLLQLLSGPWAAAFVVAGGAFVAAAVVRRCADPPAFVLSIAAFLVLHAGYQFVLSPVAQENRAPDVQAFVKAVGEEQRPADRVEILKGVSNSVFFLLRLNQPALNVGDIETYDAWAPRGGRLLLVSSAFDVLRLERRWPGRFCPVVRRDFARALGGLVLLEDSAARRYAQRDDVPLSSCAAIVGPESGGAPAR